MRGLVGEEDLVYAAAGGEEEKPESMVRDLDRASFF